MGQNLHVSMFCLSTARHKEPFLFSRFLQQPMCSRCCLCSFDVFPISSRLCVWVVQLYSRTCSAQIHSGNHSHCLPTSQAFRPLRLGQRTTVCHVIRGIQRSWSCYKSWCSKHLCAQSACAAKYWLYFGVGQISRCGLAVLCSLLCFLLVFVALCSTKIGCFYVLRLGARVLEL